jgi:hypothetical protein
VIVRERADDCRQEKDNGQPQESQATVLKAQAMRAHLKASLIFRCLPPGLFHATGFVSSPER